MCLYVYMWQENGEIVPHSRLYYHLVWSTKCRLNLLEPDVRGEIYSLLQGKAVGLGAAVYAVGGTSDHVHMVVSIPPPVSVADFVGQVKGASAAIYNKTNPNRPSILWQTGYAAFTIERSKLSVYVRYALNQPEKLSRA